MYFVGCFIQRLQSKGRFCEARQLGIVDVDFCWHDFMQPIFERLRVGQYFFHKMKSDFHVLYCRWCTIGKT